jgi:DNA modification methylase
MAPLFDLRQGDVLQRLREIPSGTVSCCVTSVPYWGLRSYNVPATVWGGSAQCPHVWTAEVPVQSGSGLHRMPANQTGGTKDFSQRATNQGQFCFHCSAWRGCLGLEPTPAQYLANMVAVFREVRRVLHSSGTLWLNIGDSYCSDAGADRLPSTTGGPLEGLRAKDLVMMPARLALALHENAWWLRCQIPWLKSNPMPESCTDRPGSSVEYIYLLAKSEAYFYDREAVRINSSGNGHDRGQGVNPKAMGPNSGMKRDRDPSHQSAVQIKHRQNRSFSAAVHAVVPTRSRRNTDWFFASLESYTRGFQGLLVDGAADPLALLVNPQPFSLEMCVQCKTCYAQREYRKLELDGKTRRCCCGASEWISHFATFPEQMVTPCILAGTSEHGRCKACGAPYERVIERARVGDWHPDPERKHDAGAVNGTAKWAKSGAVDARNGMKLQSSAGTGSHTKENPPAPATLGWRPTCSHPLFESEIVPCVVLDPFSGSGRTGLAANRHGRDFIGIEANGHYVRMAEWQKSKSTEVQRRF